MVKKINRMVYTFARTGCQEKKGCVDQILTIRLLCDYAKKKRKKLYLLYIDFEKAYDKVPRDTLLHILKSLGCGGRFLNVLSKIYSDIKMSLHLQLFLLQSEHDKGLPQAAACSSSCIQTSW